MGQKYVFNTHIVIIEPNKKKTYLKKIKYSKKIQHGGLRVSVGPIRMLTPYVFFSSLDWA